MSKRTPRSYIDSAARPVWWYVVASRTGAAIYEDGEDKRFRFIERLENKKGQLTEGELDSDKPGRGFSSGGGGVVSHGLDRRSQQHELVAEKFAKRIAEVLLAARTERRFSDLVLVAEPHFLGLLRSALDAGTKALVRYEVGREYAKAPNSELRSLILKAIVEETMPAPSIAD